MQVVLIRMLCIDTPYIRVADTLRPYILNSCKPILSMQGKRNTGSSCLQARAVRVNQFRLHNSGAMDLLLDSGTRYYFRRRELYRSAGFD